MNYKKGRGQEKGKEGRGFGGGKPLPVEARVDLHSAEGKTILILKKALNWHRFPPKRGEVVPVRRGGR